MSTTNSTRATRAFQILLALALVAFAYMASSFAGSLLAAAVVTLLVWPVHARVLRLCRSQHWLATGITTVGVCAGLVGLLGMVAGVAIPEIGRLAQDVADLVEGAQLDDLLARLGLPALERWLSDLTGDPVDLSDTIATSVRSGVVASASAIAQTLPSLLNITGRAVLRIVIFVLGLGSFLAHGPGLVAWVRKLSPLAPDDTDQIFHIFASFSRNVVLAGGLGGLVQGLVAGIGYALAGVDRALLFGLLTAVVAYVPMIGTTLVWVPLSLLLVAQGHNGTAVFVIIWSVALTGTVDNLVKPLIVRGESQLPTLLIFLGVFGGLSWMGLIGILVGPVLVATLVSLLRIYERQILDPTRATLPPQAP